MSRMLTALCLSIILVTFCPAAAPKLLVFVSVDQLRGDLPTLMESRLGEGGLKWLMNQGTYFTAAHYRHASTVTAVGHATMVTGANPPEHGIVENKWFSRETGERVYCVEDATQKLVGVEGGGMSPKSLLVSTIGDELIMASAGRSRVFGVSFKDRSAILMAGHLGKALWFHGGSGNFVSTDYYYPELPAWVASWNESKHTEQYRGTVWNLLKPLETYVRRDEDARAVEVVGQGLTNTFPHDLSQVPPTFLNSALTGTPFADKIGLEFCKALIANERLGQGDATDMLCVSLSATDVVGHVFGPTSLEMEDMILQLDASLADFFAYLQDKIGLDKCLVVLTADHGGHEVAEHTAAMKFPGNRIERDTLIPPLNALLKEKFGVEDLVAGVEPPHVFLNMAMIRAANLDEATVNEAAAAHLRQQPGILYALTREQILEHRIPDALAARRIARSFHPHRGGNVLVAEEPYWYFYNGGQGGTHSGPWNYDTFVPIMFAGSGIPARRVAREAGPEDIACTLANMLGILPPSGSVGTVLSEALPVAP